METKFLISTLSTCDITVLLCASMSFSISESTHWIIELIFINSKIPMLVRKLLTIPYVGSNALKQMAEGTVLEMQYYSGNIFKIQNFLKFNFSLKIFTQITKEEEQAALLERKSNTKSKRHSFSKQNTGTSNSLPLGPHR